MLPATITIATDTQKSSAVYIPPGNYGFSLFVPTIDNGTVRIEVYTNQQQPAPSDKGNAVLAATYDNDWVQVATNLHNGTGAEVVVVGNAWPLERVWVRVVTGAVQTANRTFRFILAQ